MSDDLASNAVVAVTAFYTDLVAKLKKDAAEREKFWRSEVAKSSALNGNLASQVARLSGKTIEEVLLAVQKPGAEKSLQREGGPRRDRPGDGRRVEQGQQGPSITGTSQEEGEERAR